MLEMGVVVGLGLLVILVKMSWRWKLWVLSHPLLIDMVVLAILLVVHWGTFSGVMVATVGALFCSIVLSIGRWAIGHVEKNQYVRGVWDISARIKG